MSYFLGTETKIISAQIAQRSTYGKDQIDFLTRTVHDFDNSDRRKFMDVAWRYYRNENDITKAIRYVIGRDKDNNAIKKQSTVLSNNRLAHNFMKKLTRQKIAYMLGKPFILTAKQRDDTQAEAYFKATKDYLNEEFLKKIKNVARDSIVCGLGWIQVYYNEEGKLSFRRCAPEEIIPFWRDSDHTVLDAIVRRYDIEYYKKQEKVTTTYLEYYLPEGTFYYVQSANGDFVPDPEHRGIQPHFVLKSQIEGEPDKGIVWERLPFIPFKYDADEQSLLARIKTLIDDYDRKTSDIANDIDDFPNSMLVIKNYDGESREDFVARLNDYRMVFVQGDGDAKSLQTPLDVESVDKHLERLRQDIFEFGQGVNTADKDIRDTSGVALRFIYADLDMDCVDWGEEVRWALKQLLWFVQRDILARTGEDYTDVDYTIVFNTDVIVNESETITNCLNSKSIISETTIAANHPWVLNAKKEVEEMREKQEEDLKLEAKYNTKITTAQKGSAQTGTMSYKNKSNPNQKNT